MIQGSLTPVAIPKPEDGTGILRCLLHSNFRIGSKKIQSRVPRSLHFLQALKRLREEGTGGTRDKHHREESEVQKELRLNCTNGRRTKFT